LAGTTYNEVLCAGVCPEMRPVAPVKKGKKGQKLSCVKLAICPDHPRRHRPLKFCMRGRVREVVIYFKFHETRSRGLGAVEGRKLPSPIDKACTSRDITVEPRRRSVEHFFLYIIRYGNIAFYASFRPL